MSKLFLNTYANIHSIHYDEVIIAIFQTVFKLFLNVYVNVHSIYYEELIIAMEVKKYMHKLPNYMDKVAMTEMYDKQAPKYEPDVISYYMELRPNNDQPGASWSTAPAQSLPSTTRPAGAGSSRRAGLPTRLVTLSLTMCLTISSLCDLNVNKAKNNKESLSTYQPLNMLVPSTLSSP